VPPQALPVRKLGNEPLQLLDELTAAPELELSLDPGLQDVAPELVQANRFGTEGALVGEIGEGPAPPQPQRTLQ
jgi:hypothetical protein